MELIKVIRCNIVYLMFYIFLVIVFLMGIKEELKKKYIEICKLNIVLMIIMGYLYIDIIWIYR